MSDDTSKLTFEIAFKINSNAGNEDNGSLISRQVERERREGVPNDSKTFGLR